MSSRSAVARAAAASVLFASFIAIPLTASAQGSGRGFLFGQPNGSFTLSGGIAQPTANSDIYSFVHDNLTLGKRDFLGPTFGANLDVRIAPRFALQFNTGFYQRSIDSEVRAYTDNSNNPIAQNTRLTRVPLMIGLRYDLTPSGRALGNLAWVPSRITPYIAAGAGGMWYRFKQEGDFIDFQSSNLAVVPLRLESTGWAGAAYGALGADISVSPVVSIRTEARYDEAKGTLGRDFSGFNRIDLSGFNATVGLSFRY
jgi:hypothetical protein